MSANPPKIDEYIKETGEWWQAWDKLVETNKELKTTDFESSINELRKIFPSEWVKNNLSRHHYAYYLCIPKIPGNRHVMLSIGKDIDLLGGMEILQNETIGNLKTVKNCSSALYEIKVLAYLKREGYPMEHVSQIPIIGRGVKKPDIRIEKDSKKFWVEVKYKRFPDLLRIVDKREKEIIKKFLLSHLEFNNFHGEIDLGINIIEINKLIKENRVHQINKYIKSFKDSLEELLRKRLDIAERILLGNELPYEIKKDGVYVRIKKGLSDEISIKADGHVPLIGVRFKDIDYNSMMKLESLLRLKHEIKYASHQIPDETIPMILIIRPIFPILSSSNIFKNLTLSFKLAKEEEPRVNRIEEIWLDSLIPEKEKDIVGIYIGKFIKIMTNQLV